MGIPVGLYGIVLLSLVVMDPTMTVWGITTTHYNKPQDATIPSVASETKKEHEDRYFNVTLPPSERQKRLLPYMNFYLRQPFNQPYRQQPQPQLQSQNLNLQRYRILVAKPDPLQPFISKFNELTAVNIQPPPHRHQGKVEYTPFTDTNALPGPFHPMKSHQLRPNDQPNFGEIYDTLVKLKYSQNHQGHYQSPQYEQYYQAVPPRKIVQPGRTTVHTYTPTEVDVPPPPPAPLEYQQVYQQNPIYREQRPIQIIGFVNPAENQQELRHGVIILAEKQPSQPPSQPQPPVFHDIQQEKQRIFQEQLRIYEDQQHAYRNEQKLLEEQERRKLVEEEERRKSLEEEERRKYAEELQKQLVYAPSVQQENPPNHRYVQIQAYQHPTYQAPLVKEEDPAYTTQTTQQYPITERPNHLAEILKRLQASNTLPQNLTPENIDNSIKTLVKILNMLRKHQRLSKNPIVVPDQGENVVNNEAGVVVSGQSRPANPPDTVVQTFPDTRVEDGAPGKAGVDYPALATIPQTSFNCKTQRYKGFFGDPDTNCQVWHYCDFNGGQASFLCPNGTIFSQVALTCDWWYNVKCSTTSQLYVLNERLYKYILPFSPKFPEDYSGPLVDRYLAMKFQEMEEQMKKQRKKPKESNEEETKDDGKEEPEKEMEIDDADQLRQQNEESRRNATGFAAEDIEGNNVRRSAVDSK